MDVYEMFMVRKSLHFGFQFNFLDSLAGLAWIDLEVAFANGVHSKSALTLFLLADFESSAFGGRDYEHGLVGILTAHRLANLHAIFEGYVVVGTEAFVVQEFLLYLSVERTYLGVKHFLLGSHIVNFTAHVNNVSFELRIFLSTNPFDGVFV